MYDDGITMTDAFTYSDTPIDVELETVIEKMTVFLDYHDDPLLVGSSFLDMLGEGDGRAKFRNLLEKTGYAGDAEGFCKELISRLSSENSTSHEELVINGVHLPAVFLTAVLETLSPGDRCISVHRVEQLERITNTQIAEKDHEDMQKVLDTYPVRLSMHTIRQMRVSRDVAYQYMPFLEELDPVGHSNTWIGQFHQGLLEQMYQNRVIFLLNMSCPVYCRFCFRKHKESRNQANPTPDDVQKAVDHIRNSPKVKEIVITGGDPFLNRANMAAAIDGLMEIPHVQKLRLATRSVAYYPHLFLGGDGELLDYLQLKNLELQRLGKRMELATHFIHPDEISSESLYIISRLVSSGIAVYIQTPFLHNCNDKGPELVRLYHLLRGAGAEMHYIYIPCSPIHGNSIYWTPISTGVEVAAYLRAHLSDRALPRICTATQIGKMDWHSSGWAVEQDSKNDRFIWIRTPYTPDYFKAFAPIADDLDFIRVNEEGTIEVGYMADIGDPALFKGNRGPVSKPPFETDFDALAESAAGSLDDQRLPGSIVSTGSDAIRRFHETGVELDFAAGDSGIAYIRNHPAITDVVLSGQKDAVDHLYDIARIVQELRGISHLRAVRLRSLKFNYRPEAFDRMTINRLGELNRLTVNRPLRIEIETRFLHASEIRTEHEKTAGKLLNRGVTVYANTPLLSGINTGAGAIHELAYGLRRCGVEFHHLYVAGLPVQKQWNRKRPVDISDVIDIAGKVRREGSGREIPRYIIRTELGEIDFGLTSGFIDDNGKIRVELTPYNLAYFQAMQPDFTWPDGVQCNPAGRPSVAVDELTSSDGFMVEKT